MNRTAFFIGILLGSTVSGAAIYSKSQRERVAAVVELNPLSSRTRNPEGARLDQVIEYESGSPLRVHVRRGDGNLENQHEILVFTQPQLDLPRGNFELLAGDEVLTVDPQLEFTDYEEPLRVRTWIRGSVALHRFYAKGIPQTAAGPIFSLPIEDWENALKFDEVISHGDVYSDTYVIFKVTPSEDIYEELDRLSLVRQFPSYQKVEAKPWGYLGSRQSFCGYAFPATAMRIDYVYSNGIGMVVYDPASGRVVMHISDDD